MVNRYPGVLGLVYKDSYIKTMKIGHAIDKDLFKFVPR